MEEGKEIENGMSKIEGDEEDSFSKSYPSLFLSSRKRPNWQSNNETRVKKFERVMNNNRNPPASGKYY